MDVSIDISSNGSTVIVRPRGHLRVTTTKLLYDELERLAGQRSVEVVVVDFAHVQQMDSSAIATVVVGKRLCEQAKKRFELRNLSREHREAFELMPHGEANSGAETSVHPLVWLGEGGFAAWETIKGFYNLITDTVFVVLGMLRGRTPPRHSFTEQSVAIGVNALPIVALLSLLLGLIMAFQSAYQLRQFGASIFVANLVGISMVREFGPMMTAIIVAGRSGSAIAAELGTMVVQEEIDALKTMGIDPNRHLLLPRILAITVVQPALTVLANIIGIFGGFLIGTLYLDLSASAYVNQTIEALSMGDVMNGLLKSLVFAWLIGIIGCYCGFTIKGGASGVGRATTRAVVMSIFLIIVADSVFTTVTTLIK